LDVLLYSNTAVMKFPWGWKTIRIHIHYSTNSEFNIRIRRMRTFSGFVTSLPYTYQPRRSRGYHEIR